MLHQRSSMTAEEFALQFRLWGSLKLNSIDAYVLLSY